MLKTSATATPAPAGSPVLPRLSSLALLGMTLATGCHKSEPSTASDNVSNPPGSTDTNLPSALPPTEPQSLITNTLPGSVTVNILTNAPATSPRFTFPPHDPAYPAGTVLETVGVKLTASLLDSLLPGNSIRFKLEFEKPVLMNPGDVIQLSLVEPPKTTNGGPSLTPIQSFGVREQGLVPSMEAAVNIPYNIGHVIAEGYVMNSTNGGFLQVNIISQPPEK